MKRILYICLFTLVAVACRKEDDPAPSTNWLNDFDVLENATDAESVLRREFLSETGCYLLFNDTIHKEFVRYNNDGEAIYSIETIDLSYSISSAGRNKQSFTYLSSIEQKKEAVKFVKDNLLALMSEDVYPYSVLLVDSIFSTSFHYEQGSDESGIYGDRTFVRYYSGERCLAVSTGDIGQMEETDRKNAIKDIISAMIVNKFSLNAEWTTSFYAFYEGLYGLIDGDLDYDYWEEAEGWNYNPDAREFGFLSGEITWDDYYESYLLTSPIKDQDLADYVNVLIAGDEEEFLNENEEFPIVIEKYGIMKRIVEEMGFDLSKLK